MAMNRSPLVLDPAQLRAWAETAARNKAEITRLTDEMADAEAYLSAARLLWSNEAVDAAIRDAASTVNEEELTYPAFIMRALQDANVGLTMQELYEFAAENPIWRRLEKNRNALYTAVARLESKGEVIRHGRLYYASDVYEAVQRGGVFDPRYSTATDEPVVMPMAIRRLLIELGRAATPAEIIEFLKDIPAFRERIERNPQYVYTVLSRMHARDDVLKDAAGQYFVTRAEREPPS
jgi:hypothetical protein